MKYVPMVKRPRADWFEDEKPVTVQTSMTVWETELEPEDTGLLDSNGTRLYRMPDKRKIGYL